MGSTSTKIRGITIQLGMDASGVDKGFADVNKSITHTQKSLKDVEKLLKLDPTNTELLKQKQELLAEQIGNTSDKLEVLKQAEAKVQEQFEKGDASKEQYDALKREIIDTEIALKNLENKAESTDKAIRGIDEKPIDEVTKAAKDAEEELKDAGNEASNFADYLQAALMVEGASNLVSSLKDAAEESKEYMKIMGSLEVSSKAAGYSTEETSKKFKELYSVLGDDQTAATTTANLQALGLEQKELDKITNATIGAWAKYGDSIPIDGLAESINETVKVGQVTGTFADVLNWAGVSEDKFNEKLEKASTEAERADLVLKAMAKQGLVEAGEAWKENNEVLVENNEANADLQEQLAQLGELILPILTEIVSKGTELLSWFNSLNEETQKTIISVVGLVAALGPVISVIGGISGSLSGMSGMFNTVTKTVLPALQNGFSSTFSFIASNPVVLLITAIVAMVALFATKGDEIKAILKSVDNFLQQIFVVDWSKVFGSELGEPLNAFFNNVHEIWDSIKSILKGMINFVEGTFSGDWKKAWKGVVQIFDGIFSGLVGIAKIPLNGIIGLLNGAVGAINKLIEGFNNLGFDMPKWLGGGSWHPNIPTISKIPYLANGGILWDGSAVVGEAGPELLTMSGNHAIVQPLTSSNTSDSGFGELIDMLGYYLPYIVENMENPTPYVIGERSFKRGLINMGVKFE